MYRILTLFLVSTLIIPVFAASIDRIKERTLNCTQHAVKLVESRFSLLRFFLAKDVTYPPPSKLIIQNHHITLSGALTDPESLQAGARRLYADEVGKLASGEVIIRGFFGANCGGVSWSSLICVLTHNGDIIVDYSDATGLTLPGFSAVCFICPDRKLRIPCSQCQAEATTTTTPKALYDVANAMLVGQASSSGVVHLISPVGTDLCSTYDTALIVHDSA